MGNKFSLIVFRHGKTSFDLDRIFCGWINMGLDSVGISEAKILAKKIKKENIDVGVCSALLRSKQALVYVFSEHPGSKVIIDHRIRERNYGIFSGHSKKLFKELFPEKYKEIHRGYYANIPKGENLSNVGVRVFQFMNDLLKFMKKEKVNVCISAHPSSMKLIVEYLEGLSKEQVEKAEFSPNSYKKYVLSFD
jgi:bisphosphoglycerate-dependent phosphoglycerate mutase